MEKNYLELGKYNSIPFWRVVFTYAIVVFHFSTTYTGMNAAYDSNIGWRIAVEFFFVVSGFLLAHKCRKSEELSAWDYTVRRYWRLFPEYMFTLIVMVVYRIIDAELDFEQGFRYVLNSADEIMMLQGTAINYVNVNGAIWYLSAMLVCGYFIYYLYKWHRKLFVGIIAPLSSLLIFSYLSYKLGSANGNIMHFTGGGVAYGMLRGFGTMCMGVLSYEMGLRFSKLELTKGGEIFFSVLEVLAYVHVLWYTFKYGSTKMDFVFIVYFAFAVMLSFSRKKRNIIYNNKLVDMLSAISYSIYLIHIFVIRVYSQFYTDLTKYGEKMFLLYAAIVTVSAALVHVICMLLVGLFWKNKKKLAGLFVKQAA